MELKLKSIRALTVVAPAAGADFDIPVAPLGGATFWRLVSLGATMTTSAGAANREVSIRLFGDATNFVSIPAGLTHIASQVRFYNWGPGLRAGAGATALDLSSPLELWMPSGFALRTITLNIQAADQWGTARLVVEEWGQ